MCVCLSVCVYVCVCVCVNLVFLSCTFVVVITAKLQIFIFVHNVNICNLCINICSPIFNQHVLFHFKSIISSFHYSTISHHFQPWPLFIVDNCPNVPCLSLIPAPGAQAVFLHWQNLCSDFCSCSWIWPCQIFPYPTEQQLWHWPVKTLLPHCGRVRFTSRSRPLRVITV